MVATLVSGVVAAHGGARVQDVFEDVVGIGAVRAGQLGADVAAGIKELVARQAGAVEDGPAARRVRRRVLSRRRAPTCTWPPGRPWLSRSAGPCPRRLRAARRIRGSPKASNWRAIETLTSRRGMRPRSMASSSASAHAGRAASVAIASSRSDSVILAVAAQDDLGRRGIVVGRQRPQRRAAQGRVVDQTRAGPARARARAAPRGPIRPAASYRAASSRSRTMSPQYARCLGLVEVERQQEGLFDHGQVGSRQQPGEGLRPAVGPGDVLAAPQGVVGADQEVDASRVVRRL